MRPAVFVWLVTLLAPSVAIATEAEVYICERPGGELSVTTFATGDRHGTISRMEQDGILPSVGACWWADSATLPAKSREDPNAPGERVTQRHRWRRGPDNTVIVDSAVKRPDNVAILRQFRKEIPPRRRAAILATALGSNLHQALRDGDFALAKALMGQIAARVGMGQEVMTAAEVARMRQVARDYEADLEEGSP